MAAPQPAGGGGGGNLLTQKLGPLATWAWLLIATVLVGVVYLFLKHKQGATPAAPAAGAAGSATGVGQVPDIVLQNYYGNTPSGAATTTPPPVTTPPPAGSVPPAQPPPTTTTTAPAQVTVPSVVGQRANFAIGQLESIGLTWTSTSGPRNPKDEYSVSAQKQAPGTKVAKGTAVALTYKVIATPATAKKK